jgi:hypothetical protein
MSMALYTRLSFLFVVCKSVIRCGVLNQKKKYGVRERCILVLYGHVRDEMNMVGSIRARRKR